MTLNLVETSAYQSAPIDFFRFRYGNKYIYQVSASEDLVGPLSVTYKATQITRTMTSSSSELNKNPIDLQVDITNPIVSYFRTGQPDEVLFISVFVRHSTDEDSEFILSWQGRVTNCELDGDFAKLICEPVSNSLRRLGLRAKYQVLCRHALYDARCGASEIKAPVFISSVSASGTQIVISSTGQPDNFFTGGSLTLSSGGSRMIASQIGNILTISHPFNAIYPSEPAEVIAGCNHGREDCITKFNNLPHFGGFPYIPKKNPFSGAINQ